MILIIDNYDSFTYNLYQYVGQITTQVEVVRNDKTTVAEIINGGFSHIIVSPGPGRPEQTGIVVELLQKMGRIPILGVCLGHQAIAHAFGGRILQMEEPVHGKQDRIMIAPQHPLFQGLGSSMLVGRYHSLVVEQKTLPACLQITARNREGHIMGLRHRERPIFGVQFHPESILTPEGCKIMQNFVHFNGAKIQKSYGRIQA